MSSTNDHHATIVDRGIRMKIKRRLPPPTQTGAGNSPTDDVSAGNLRATHEAKRRRLKGTKVALRNGNAEDATATGSGLAKRKRVTSSDCDDVADGCVIGRSDDGGNTASPSPTSSAVDGIATNLRRQPHALNLHQVNNLPTLWHSAHSMWFRGSVAVWLARLTAV